MYFYRERGFGVPALYVGVVFQERWPVVGSRVLMVEGAASTADQQVKLLLQSGHFGEGQLLYGVQRAWGSQAWGVCVVLGGFPFKESHAPNGLFQAYAVLVPRSSPGTCTPETVLYQWLGAWILPPVPSCKKIPTAQKTCKLR